MMDVNDYKAEIYYRILYRALSACCLYLRSSLLNEDKTNRVRGYVRDFYLNDKIVRRFVLDKNRLVAVIGKGFIKNEAFVFLSVATIWMFLLYM